VRELLGVVLNRWDVGGRGPARQRHDLQQISAYDPQAPLVGLGYIIRYGDRALLGILSEEFLWNGLLVEDDDVQGANIEIFAKGLEMILGCKPIGLAGAGS
jgi:hypothetical protein